MELVREKRDVARFWGGVVLILWFLMVIWPLGGMLVEHFLEAQWAGLTTYFLKILARCLSFTVLQGGLSALLSLGLATIFVMAWGHRFLVGSARRWLPLVDFVGWVCFVLPGSTVALLWLELREGWSWLPRQGLVPILAAHAFMNVGWVAASIFRRMLAWWHQGGREEWESARLLGASSTQAWWLCRGIFFSEWKLWGPLVFLWSATSFAPVLILGGSPAYATPEVFYFYSFQVDPETSRLFVLGCLQLFLGGLMARGIFLRVHDIPGIFPDGWERFSRTCESNVRFYALPGAWRWLSFFGLAGFLLPFVWLLSSPLLWGWSLRGLSHPGFSWGACWGSLFLMILSTALARVWGFLLVRCGSWVRRSLSIFVGLSGVMMAAAWSVRGILQESENVFLHWGATALLLVLLQVPFFSLWLEHHIAQLSRELQESARALGCSDADFPRRVLQPATREVRHKMAVLVALMSLGDLAVSGLLLPEHATLSLLARGLAHRYDFSGSSLVLGATLGLTLAVLGWNVVWKKIVNQRSV